MNPQQQQQQQQRREISMDHSGYLGNSRVVLNHFDVSTQADIHHMALSYESEDEMMARIRFNRERERRETPHYSKQDIREQYCISERGLGALESDRHGLFGCLSSHQNSPCSNRTSFLTACVRQKAPSDENLYDLYKKHQNDYAPYPRRAARYPWAPAGPEIYRFDQDLKSSYFRRKIPVDPSRYTWMTSDDDESVRMEKPKSILEPQHSNQTPSASKKHVSFARSHTLTSFDDAISLNSSSSHLGKMTRSQERLIGVRKTTTSDMPPITKQPEPSENALLIDKLKRTSMKCQATQTEACLGRRPLTPGNIHLSPRTIHRVKMVSQGAQTNGILVNGRRLTKSFSEAGYRFQGIGSGSEPNDHYQNVESYKTDHEPLHRTQSDEPPRSPFNLNPSPTINPSSPRDSEGSEAKKEIFIDFKPQVKEATSTKFPKRPLTKAMSDGEILLDQNEVLSPKPLTSMSQECIKAEEETPARSFVPYFQKAPIRHEGIFRKLDDPIFSSSSFDDYNSGQLQPQDSIDEEFHENLIYNRIYMNLQDSLDKARQEVPRKIETSRSPNDECVVPSISLLSGKKSPFTSNDSLANDQRDHSDGIWNESQVTVLQLNSGTDNDTAVSSSEMASLTSPSTANFLTPSSRRRHILFLQHQQRSSFDTENLDDEQIKQHDTLKTSPTAPIQKLPEQNTPRIVINRAKPQQNQLYRKKNSPLSSTWKRKVPESPARSPQPAVVPDFLQTTRNDSYRTNTDVSESTTTTTDDYITANSGTDSSKKSGSNNKGNELYSSPRPAIAVGGGFDEPNARPSSGDFLEDMVVPSVRVPSPFDHQHHQHHHHHRRRSLSNTPTVPHHESSPKTGRSTPSDTSSSCGSYSVDGSCPDLLDRTALVPSKHTEEYSRNSEDEHLANRILKESQQQQHQKKRPYILEIKQQHQETQRLSPNDKQQLKPIATSNRLSPSKSASSDKPKRTKMRTRSPMQGQKKFQQHSRKSAHYLRTDAVDEDGRFKQRNAEEAKATSDESSCDFGTSKYATSQTSPRKWKKNKDAHRRKSLPRSPVNLQPGRRNSDEKSVSLPGSLQRRKSSSKSKNLTPTDNFTPVNRSPVESPSINSKSPENARLKALSAESLRSVSPGSDSVFYSDPSSHTADHQVHCLHCGKEVDLIATATDLEKSSNGSSQHDIVQPPAGFEDSPKLKHPPCGKLYKKFNRRIRSEERNNIVDQKKYRYKPDVRAKSEERDGGGGVSCSKKLRPMGGNSREGLKTTDSSPSILPGAPDDEDDDVGIYDVSYTESFWIKLDEREMQSKMNSPTDRAVRRNSVSSTESEQDFKKRYQSVIHRMVHRKSCLEMYKRQTSRSFENGFDNDSNEEQHYQLRHQLEEILKLMLVIWCKENQALNLITSERSESDKTVVVQRQSGEFGFRIHGSKPVVVSAIEPGTPAETSGLEVGDIVLAVNGVSVIDKSHSEVVKIAHAGSDTLSLEVARTCYALSTSPDLHSAPALYSGYLWKLSGFASGLPSNKWIRRWFILRQNNCLYYYKTDTDKQPVGAVMLYDHEVQKINETDSSSKQHRFVIQRPDSVPLHLAADNSQAEARWVEVINKAINDSQIVDEFLEQTKRNLGLAPCSISTPDCFGYLVKLGNQWKSWSRRYCVLKDACLYFYSDANSKNAFGVAYLHGYRVQQSLPGSKKHAFEIIPPDPDHKHYYFHTESDTDRRRWIAALEYSIDRWLKIH